MNPLRSLSPARCVRHMLYTAALSAPGVGLLLALVGGVGLALTPWVGR